MCDQCGMAALLSLPCPVRLGVMRQGGPQAEFHRCTLERNVNKMEKLLKKGALGYLVEGMSGKKIVSRDLCYVNVHVIAL